MARRSRERTFIGLGSNQRDPIAQLVAALAALAGHAGIDLVARSRPFRTSPWGRPDQAPFVNAVAELRTGLAPAELLAACLAVETGLGRRRIRESRWGPRPIDLDLLAVGDRRLAGPGLQLPHPRLAERRFVLAPWADVAPDFEVPGLGTVAALLRACGDIGSAEPLDWPDAASGTTMPGEST